MDHFKELSAYAKVKKHPLLPDFYILTLNVDNRMQEFQLSNHALGTIGATLGMHRLNQMASLVPRPHASSDPTP
jgi:hypothetical protein